MADLCASCGLCCDGSLFGYVTVSLSEMEALVARDVAVGSRPDGDGYRLSQRCPALEGTLCRAYEVRPSGCRAYECQLYAAHRDREVSTEEALRTVEEAKALLQQLSEALPSSPLSRNPVQRVRRSLAGEEPALTEQATTAWTAVRDFLRTHFTGRHGLS